MLLLDLLVFFLIYILLKYKRTNSARPEMIFLIVWIVIIVIYLLDVINLYEVSFKTIMIIMIGTIAFVFGCRIPIRIMRNNEKYNETIQYSLNYYLTVIIGIFSIVILLSDVILTINSLIAGASFEDIILKMGPESAEEGIIRQFGKIYIAYPFSYAIIPISLTELFSDTLTKNKKIVISVIAVLIIAFRTLHHGARFYIVLIVVYLALLFLIMFRNKKESMSRKTKISIIVCVIIIFLLFYLISDSRGISELGKSLYLYICGGISLLNQAVQNSKSNYTFGFSSFYGAFAAIMYPLRGLGIVKGEWFQYVSNIVNVEGFRYIGPTTKLNAFVTVFYYPYLDFGYIGVAIIMFIYGVIAINIYLNMDHRGNMGRVLYLTILMSIITSGIRMQFSTYAYTLSYIYIVLLYSKRKEDGRKK